MKSTKHPDRNLSILYLITGLRLGGAERQLLLLATRMQSAGLNVLVVAMRSGGILVQNFRDEGIEVKELEIEGAYSLISGYRRLKRVVSCFSPDVIHTHMIHANIFGRIFKVFHPGYKLISTAHNIREGSAVMMKSYYFTRSIADWSTNVSRQALEHYVNKGYFSAKRSSYVPNAIDLAEFYPDERLGYQKRKELGISIDSYIYFSAGRLHEQKDHHLLLQSFKIVSGQFPRAILVLAGEGALLNDLITLSIQLGIDKKTFFLGRREDISTLLNMCDCFVLTSRYEGFGMVVAEALATMKPVISTDCGGVREVIGKYGTLVKVGDVNEMSAAMIKQLGCGSKSNVLSAGRRHVEQNYSIDSVVAQWSKLYRDKV